MSLGGAAQGHRRLIPARKTWESQLLPKSRRGEKELDRGAGVVRGRRRRKRRKSGEMDDQHHPLHVLHSLVTAYIPNAEWPLRCAESLLTFIAWVCIAGTAGTPEEYKRYTGTTVALICGVLVWLYVTGLVVLQFGNGRLFFTHNLPSFPVAVRFGVDLSCTLLLFIAGVSLASTINNVCRTPGVSSCCTCAAVPYAPAECQVPAAGGISFKICPCACANVDGHLTLATGSHGGEYIFACWMLFLSFFAFALSNIFTWSATQPGGSPDLSNGGSFYEQAADDDIQGKSVPDSTTSYQTPTQVSVHDL